MKKQRWQIYKSLHSGRWIAWYTGWSVMSAPLKFDTWQQAIDYAMKMRKVGP